MPNGRAPDGWELRSQSLIKHARKRWRYRWEAPCCYKFAQSNSVSANGWYYATHTPQPHHTSHSRNPIYTTTRCIRPNFAAKHIKLPPVTEVRQKWRVRRKRHISGIYIGASRWYRHATPASLWQSHLSISGERPILLALKTIQIIYICFGNWIIMFLFSSI